MQTEIEVRGLHKKFGNLEVLKNISLEIQTGSVTAIIGPSGSGKSTLLRCMNLLTLPDHGSIRVEDDTFSFDGKRRLPSERARAKFRANTGMVFQHFNLFPHMTVLQNVMEGPVHTRGMPKAAAETVARDLLAKVGLSEKAGELPSRLSGGQKQRVAIARALALSPKVMLFDEATSALDPELVGEVLATMRDLASEGMTMVVVTHEISFARDVADRIIFMRDGIVVEDGHPTQLIDNPKNEETRSFLRHFHLSRA